jgi:dihydrofolate reductase
VKVSLIAAVAENGVIGRDNDLPWKIKDDMRFFVRTTKGHTVVMGRLNFDAMGRPLPKRRNIVVSRGADYRAEGCEAVTSIEQALRLAEAAGEDEAFIIGGAQIYALAFPFADRFYRTRVLAEVPGDVVFPEIDVSEWKLTQLESGEISEENEHAFVVELLERQEPPQPFSVDET